MQRRTFLSLSLLALAGCASLNPLDRGPARATLDQTDPPAAMYREATTTFVGMGGALTTQDPQDGLFGGTLYGTVHLTVQVRPVGTGSQVVITGVVPADKLLFGASASSVVQDYAQRLQQRP